MMNLLLTLLTLAGGIFIGSAGVFLSRKKMSNIQNVFAWFGLLILLFAVGTIGILCEEKINFSRVFPFLSEITTAIIIVYGIILGIIISLRGDIEKEIKKGKKSDWQTILGGLGFAKFPLIIWIVLCFAPLSCWNALAFAIMLGFTLTTVLYIVFGFATWIHKHTKN